MGYTAGTLDLSILGTSNEAIISIDKTVKSLNSLSRAINKINNLPVLGASSTITIFFKKLAESTNQINTSNIVNLAYATKSLNSISRISNLEKIDWKSVSAGFSSLTTAITPFIDKVKEAETSLNALYGILNKSSGKKIGNVLNDTMGGSSKSSRSTFRRNPLSKIFKVASWTFVLHSARRLGGIIEQIADKGGDFGETLNLWKVSMGQDFLPQASEFVRQLNEAYGVSKELLMNSQAIFKNMLGSLGQISNETAYKLSEGVTQMALDYASLYNVKFEDAMTKFQAALAGQVRPIRSVAGYDITETTLFQLYEQLGGTKTMRQLNRTEKQLLSIYAVFEQMDRSGAIGDLDKTINSWANQSRVMADSWKDIQTYAGLTITRLLETSGVMKYVNAILIFMSRILEGLATSLDTGLGNSGEVFVEMETDVNGATESVESLNEALLDFDKFRALDDTNSISDSDNDNLGIDQTIIDAMTRYDSILSDASLEARKIADSWLESLGLVDENNDGILDIYLGMLNIDSILNTALQSIDSILNTAIQKFNTWLATTDFSAPGLKLSEALGEAISSISDKIDRIDWGSLGSSLAEFINGVEFEKVLNELDLLIRNILGGSADFLVNLLLNIEWKIVTSEDMPLMHYIDIIIIELVNQLIQLINDIFVNALNKYFGFLGVNVPDIPLFEVPEKPQLFADGGLPDKGTMFVAGEAGAEILYNMPSGQSGVANIQQIAQATYNGTIKALNDWWGGSGARGDIPQLEAANPTGLYQAVTGVAAQYGKSWNRG